MIAKLDENLNVMRRNMDNSIVNFEIFTKCSNLLSTGNTKMPGATSFTFVNANNLKKCFTVRITHNNDNINFTIQEIFRVKFYDDENNGIFKKNQVLIQDKNEINEIMFDTRNKKILTRKIMMEVILGGGIKF